MLENIPGDSQFIPDIVSHYVPKQWDMTCITRNALDLFDSVLLSHYKKFGSIFKWNFAHTSIIVIANPKFVKYLASKDGIVFKKDTFAEQMMKDLFGETILMTNNQSSWFRHRKLCSHGFTDDTLRYLCQVSNQMMEEFFTILQQQQWECNADFFSLLTMDILGKSTFSFPPDAMKSRGKHFMAQSISNIFDSVLSLSIVPSSYLRKKIFYSKSCNRALLSWIENVVHHRFQNQPQEDSFGDVLSSLLQFNNSCSGASSQGNSTVEGNGENVIPFSEKELVSTMITFLLCGYEMMGRSLLFASYLLAKNTTSQTEAQTLIDEILQGKNPTISDLSNLNLIQCIFAETMRLFPTAPVLWRESAQDFVFEGTFIPKGLYLVYPINAIGRDSNYWREADEFNPHRFDQEDVEAKMLPIFGAGPRRCLGDHFAKTAFCIILTRILQRFTITLTDPKYSMETEVKSGILRPKSPLFIRLIPRN